MKRKNLYKKEKTFKQPYRKLKAKYKELVKQGINRLEIFVELRKLDNTLDIVKFSILFPR